MKKMKNMTNLKTEKVINLMQGVREKIFIMKMNLPNRLIRLPEKDEDIHRSDA